MNLNKRSIRGALLSVAVVLAVASIPAAGGAAEAKSKDSSQSKTHGQENKAILKAIL